MCGEFFVSIGLERAIKRSRVSLHSVINVYAVVEALHTHIYIYISIYLFMSFLQHTRPTRRKLSRSISGTVKSS